MILAFAIATVLTQFAPWAAVGVAAITLAGVIWRTRGFIKGNELEGQLQQKDAIIKTNEQTIESFRSRVSALESDFAGVVANARMAESTVSRLQGQLEGLEKYAAPEAVERFESEMHALTVLINEATALLYERTSRFEAIERILSRIEREIHALQAS